MSDLPSLESCIAQFQAAMRGRGLVPDEIAPDGKDRRCKVENAKRGSKDGWYVMFPDGLGGVFENHKDGLGQETWQADRGREWTADELAQQRATIKAASEARAKAQEAEREKARITAAERWGKARPRAEAAHPYLKAKGVRAHGIRQLRAQLLVPMRDTAGKLWGLQYIQPDGRKVFGTGTAKTGKYHSIGKPTPGGVLAIVEGYATGATVYELTDWPVVIAFDAINLRPVAEALRAKYPNARLVILADNDHRSESGNTGLNKGREVAQAVDAVVLAPEFEASDPSTDWNDLAVVQGTAVARAALLTGLEQSNIADSAAVPADSDSGLASPPGETPPASSASPNDGHDDDNARARFEVRLEGVFWIDTVWDKEARRWREARPLFVCSPLHVQAVTRDTTGSGFGRLVSFENLDGTVKELVIPSTLFAGGKGDELRGRLMSEGLPLIALEAQPQRKLMEYLMHTAPPVRARCVSRVGWHGDVYVMPREAFGGDGSERYHFESGADAMLPYEQAGNLAGWIKHVSKPAGEHHRVLFAIACAFAGPLIELAGAESGGFHLVGGSSSGKTTALRLAAAVWGHPARYWRQWRTTDNGLEALAEDFNDSLLCLDEIGQADPRIIGDVAYMLANSKGKQRATREGRARAARMFRVMLLSTGEVGSAAQINASGQKSRAGHEVRLVEMAADAGKGCGLFSSAGGHASVRDLATSLTDAAGSDYGHAGPAFVARIANDREQIAAEARARIRDFVEYVCPNNASGQVLRVAQRFGLVAFAGEKATDFNLTGWRFQDVGDVLAETFHEWLRKRGTVGAREPADMIAQVKRYIEEHGGAQFQEFERSADGPGTGEEHESRVIARTGWRKQRSGATLYLCYQQKFKDEICKGYDPVEVVKALDTAGILVRNSDRLTYKHRVPNASKPIDFYAIDGDLLYGFQPR